MLDLTRNLPAPLSARAPRLSNLLGALLLAMSACGHEEPVLLGVEPETAPASPSREDVWKRVIPDERPPATAAQQAAGYVKPEGIWVDMRWFGGRRYDDVSDLLVDQLGPLVERLTLDAKSGEELRYARGEVRVVRGVVYMLRVRLPQPMTRTEALLSLGFNTHADHWRETHREYRLAYTFGFVSFRLMRAEAGSDRVDIVEGWKSRPEDVRG